MTNTLKAALIAVVAAGFGCKTDGLNASLVIQSVIAPTATVNGTSVSCEFDPGAAEFTELPYNPAENIGSIAAVVQNNLLDIPVINADFNLNTATFQPNVAVVSYEFVPASAGTPPGETEIPVAASTVPSGNAATVGFNIFLGINPPISVPNNTTIRTTMYIKGKLLDGSSVRTSEREYLFRFCTAPGCGKTGAWATAVGTPPVVVSCY